MQKKKKPEVYTFGMDNIESRLKTFKSRAKAAKNHAETIMQAAELERLRAEHRHATYEKLGEKLSEAYRKAKKESAAFRAKGKERLDGKRALALIKRGLADTCGIERHNTLLSCTNDELEMKEMFWAHKWVVTLVQDMTSQVSLSEMSKFYDIIENYKGDPEAILAEGGMMVLGKQ